MGRLVHDEVAFLRIEQVFKCQGNLINHFGAIGSHAAHIAPAVEDLVLVVPPVGQWFGTYYPSHRLHSTRKTENTPSSSAGYRRTPGSASAAAWRVSRHALYPLCAARCRGWHSAGCTLVPRHGLAAGHRGSPHTSYSSSALALRGCSTTVESLQYPSIPSQAAGAKSVLPVRSTHSGPA